MNITRYMPVIGFAGMLVLGSAGLKVSAAESNAKNVDVDNTQRNQTQDGKLSQPTADQAKNGQSDRELMQAIRKSIMNDESLSTNAKNVKVIAQNGHVTLRGVVDSQQEKSTIEAKASEVAGKEHVTNRTRVKGS